MLHKSEPMYQLSEQEAFRAMTLFLDHFYDQAGDDMETLTADISISADGRTLDPAAWNDWMRCIQAVKAEAAPQAD
jgi:hypothetical protein